MQIKSYRIVAPLRSGNRFISYRAQSDQDQDMVLKVPRTAYPAVQTLKRLEEEFDLLSLVDSPSIVRPHRLEKLDSSLALVTFEPKGVPLSAWADGECSIADFFRIAIPVTDALKSLHAHGIVHKNISPASIFIDPRSWQVTLDGFDLATRLPREGLQPNFREAQEANLQYIAPEQTGRMNRFVDQRSDLYSLGAVFYLLLTGTPAFTGNDQVEIIHAQIARQVKPPGQFNPDIPECLSAILLKLLEKSADKRYQSAAGLLYDLTQCRDLFLSSRSLQGYQIGQRDMADQFRLADKLYGREKELEQLNRLFGEVKNGQTVFVSISGYSGVGKSQVVEEFKKSVLQQGDCFFVNGKYDQFKRDIPLGALLGALRSILVQLMTEHDEALSEWRQRLQSALGPLAKVMTDILPELEGLIGKQPIVPELPPAEASNRFYEVLGRFIGCFARADKPLCVFMDDLQWMDPATRQWIETQVSAPDSGHLMIMGAYRDNEVSAGHPLMLMLDRLRLLPHKLEEIALSPLDNDSLNRMVADTLFMSSGQAAPLSSMIAQKTGGNPFFVRQCLLAMAEAGAIYFESSTPSWQYKLESARSIATADNVVDLVTAQMEKLPQGVHELLQVAACMGNRFHIRLLEQVSGLAPETLVNYINTAVQRGLIQPDYTASSEEPEQYRFLHDKVQQAAAETIDARALKDIHLRIGRCLLQQATDNLLTGNYYSIADHFYLAGDLVTDTREQEQLVHINWEAGKQAKNATAYDAALRYSTRALDYAQRCNTTEKALLRKLYLQRAECEHLTGNNAEAEAFFAKAAAASDNFLERAAVYQRKIHYHTNQRQFEQAYQTCRMAVEEAGISLPAKFIPPLLVKDLITYRIRRGRRRIPDIIHIREMSDEQYRMAILLMATAARAAYQIEPKLCVAVCVKMVNICLRHGNTDGGFIGYLALGPIFLGAILNQKQAGYDFGQLILALVEKYKSHFYKAETYFVVGYFAVPWRQPAKEMERHWQIAYEAGLEAGDFFHTSCAVCATIQSYYMRGVGFDETARTAGRYLEFLQRIRNAEGIRTIQFVLQAMNNLQGHTQSTSSWDDPEFNEAGALADISGFQSRHFAHYYFINKMQCLYLWGHYAEAYEVSLQSDRYLPDSPGMLHTAEHFFYKVLILCACYPSAGTVQQLKWRRTLSSIRNKFRSYSKGSPSNFLHKQQLLEAELAMLQGAYAKAELHYYAAIDAAASYGYVNVQGLANALAARFHFTRGHKRLTGFHLQEAVYNYEELGAGAYAASLQTRYPGVAEYLSEAATGTSANRRGAGNIDLATILKSSEAISREIHLRDLVTSVLRILMENAGAQRIVFLLQREEKIMVLASFTTTGTEEYYEPEIPLRQYTGIAQSIVNFAAHASEPLVLEDAVASGGFRNDPYIQQHQIHSVLCVPLLQQSKLAGILYLENNLTNGAFTSDRIELLSLLSRQMTISIENALLYENLEDKVTERTQQLAEEMKKSESLLLNILPAATARELKRTGSSKAREFSQVTVLFTDFKNFTSMSESMSAQDLVAEINYCYSAFDGIVARYGVEKIKTIGDSYMCAGGLPVENTTNPHDTLRAALDIQAFMREEKRKRAAEGRPFFDMRLGLHTGPVVAGIVGTRKFAYDIWGDTVNIASRMESGSEPGKINISGSTYELVKDQFTCVYRGKLEAKNKGMIDMYFVEGPR